MEDAQREPVAKIAIFTEQFHITACNGSLEHSSNVENTKRVEGEHCEHEAEMDDSQDEKCDVPQVEEDKDLLVDDILRHEA